MSRIKMNEQLYDSKPSHCAHIDVNRPLPPLPHDNKDEICHPNRANSPSTVSTSLKRPTTLPAPSNKTQSSSSSSASKDSFRRLAREILSSALLQPQSNSTMLKMPFQSVDYDGLSDTSMEVPIMLCEE